MFFSANILCKNVTADILYNLKVCKAQLYSNYNICRVSQPYKTMPPGDAKGLHINYGPYESIQNH